MKRNNNFAIIIPSYNESENLRVLLKMIHRKFPDFLIYIVDDSNKQENIKIKEMVKHYNKAFLISRRKKKGRGSAVMLGFKTALQNKSLKFFLEMDSDLAHSPDEIPRFIKKLKQNKYDLIIGSRYLPGGKIKNISKDRTILSRIINIFLKIWLGVKVTDFTSGFRLYSRKCVEYLVHAKVKSKGFITLSETLFNVHNAHLLIGEVPITWNYRVFGKSNVNLKELLISLYFVLLIKIKHVLNFDK